MIQATSAIFCTHPKVPTCFLQWGVLNCRHYVECCLTKVLFNCKMTYQLLYSMAQLEKAQIHYTFFFCLIYLRCQLQAAMDLHAKVHQCCERSCHLSSLFLTLKLSKCYILNLSWLNSICHVSAHIFQLIYILVYPLTTFLTILQRCQSCVVCKFTNQRIDLEIAPRLQWELVFLIES